jgi:hypothetical protein
MRCIGKRDAAQYIYFLKKKTIKKHMYLLSLPLEHGALYVDIFAWHVVRRRDATR